ncbi:MAG: hypothetical protein ABRQ23_00375 [Syntrophomonadaceae bacterium]
MDKMASPYDFLKSTRPDEFSDSEVIEQVALTRDFFEYYLDTLTNRNQEKLFEIFCRRMAEYEICPNLLPQTGPTGGGDSKVDTETYPVSDQVALSWYSGIGREAASERWAFAISAKKDWKTKLKADTANIISTNRGYSRIYFISNQFIPDKKRANAEDELSSKYGVDVRILDRNWLLDKLFTNHHELIAVEIFGLSGSFVDTLRLGPLDYQRKQELDELEADIHRLTADSGRRIELVEKSLDSAILSKELEVPLSEMVGRFDRSFALARSYGTPSHKKECLYQWAWSLYWWYEEFDMFYEKYCDFEQMVTGSLNPYDLERLTNLWMNLFTITGGRPDIKDFKLHTDILISEYERLIGDINRPNTALEARTNFVFVKLLLGFNEQELLGELISIINEGTGVLDFSLNTVSKMIMNLTPMLQEVPNFDELFETIVTVSSQRQQESVAAQLLLTRGKALVVTKPYTAVRYLGRALIRLYKEENKREFLLTLFLLGLACEKTELLWAARGYYLNAFNLCLVDYMKFGRVNALMAACSGSLKTIELKQGRVPQSLECYRLENMAIGLLESAGYDVKRIREGEILYDSILGLLLLGSSFDELDKIITLPDMLEKEGLYAASTAIKYVLGYIDEEILKQEGNDETAVENFMSLWYNQPAKEQIANTPEFGLKSSQRLQSKILGCQINVISDAKFPCIELAESILAALESFLATAIIDDVVCLTPVVEITVQYDPSEKFTLNFNKDKSDHGIHFGVYCSDFPPSQFKEAQIIVKEFIFGFLAEVIPRMVIFRDAEKQLEIMARDDLVFHRSIDFTGSIFIGADLFGKDVFSAVNWIPVDEKEYPLKRKQALELEVIPREIEDGKINLGEKRDINIFDRENIGQKEIEILSVINIPLWDRAKWQGMMYAFDPDGNLPILSPVFKDKKAGIEIFKEWISMVGKVDEKDLIRIGLIKGVNKKYPNYYKALFTANSNVILDKQFKAKYVTIPARFRTMESEDNKYLLTFENAIKGITDRWKYYLLPSFIDPVTNQVELLYGYSILKKDAEIKNAWEIGKDSWLAVAITPDDDPIIPPFVAEAPVTKLIEECVKKC